MKARVIINKDIAEKYHFCTIDAPIMKEKTTATSNLQKFIIWINVEYC